MVKSATLGMPRIGNNCEVSFAVEDFLNKKINQEQLLEIGKKTREENIKMQVDNNIDIIPCNDFTFFDQVLDATVFLGNIPRRYYWEGGSVPLDIYFTMITGQQREKFDVIPMNISRWFNTNYIYVVPEFTDPVEFVYSDNKHVISYLEAKQKFKVKTRPVFFGPVSYLLMGKISREDINEVNKSILIDEMIPVYEELIINCKRLGITDIQFDEPMLTQDLTREDQAIYRDFYNKLFEKNHNEINIHLVTSYGEVGNNLECALFLPVSSIHFDLCSAPKQLDNILNLLPEKMSLSLGLVDANNIWVNDLNNSIEIAEKVINKIGKDRVIIGPSSSLFLCPMDSDLEIEKPEEIDGLISFTKQKLQEISLITKILNGNKKDFSEILSENKKKIEKLKTMSINIEKNNSDKLHKILSSNNDRDLPFKERIKIQKDKIFNNNFPLMPITTNGSMPFDNTKNIEELIKESVKIQEEAGLDIICDGEFNRKNNIEFLANNLSGIFIPKFGFVQNYGTVCNIAPIIYDTPVIKNNTYVDLAKLMIKSTKKPIKISVCGPISFVNKSFILNNISHYIFQILIADIIKKEILELEKIGINIIGIDEQCFLKSLPLRDEHITEEITKLISIFKYTCKDIKVETQVHTKIVHIHFEELLENFAKLDSDVLLINTTRSSDEIFDLFISYRYPNHISLGIHDSWSDRIPTQQEILLVLKKYIRSLELDQIWISPDLGFKNKTNDNFEKVMNVIVKEVNEIRENK